MKIKEQRQQVWKPQKPTQKKEPLPQTLPRKRGHMPKPIIRILFNDEREAERNRKGLGSSGEIK